MSDPIIRTIGSMGYHNISEQRSIQGNPEEDFPLGYQAAEEAPAAATNPAITACPALWFLLFAAAFTAGCSQSIPYDNTYDNTEELLPDSCEIGAQGTIFVNFEDSNLLNALTDFFRYINNDTWFNEEGVAGVDVISIDVNNAVDGPIESLEGLQCFINLNTLILQNNDLTEGGGLDLAPLAQLTGLRYIDFSQTTISDVTSLINNLRAQIKEQYIEEFGLDVWESLEEEDLTEDIYSGGLRRNGDYGRTVQINLQGNDETIPAEQIETLQRLGAEVIF